ncbi:acidic leucine-rich nuclear phosphoprotein 32 family member B isoform X2 [Hydra vulgaris]|uniref:Acidic leucine-rich nuclear phosphoprotein 32 family member B isoform X2 n=1 Tax=Hydra vulgaris TaxID=6087 RepID=A0ABM4CJQ9_HYDVU
MEKRIELERRGLEKSEVIELILDNCRSTSIIGLTEEYCNLEVLSLINVGLTSLKGLPSLPLLRKLELSDNRITSGLELLLKTPQLTHLSLSGNKIKDIASLSPLAKLSYLKSLDLFNCDVTTEKDYRNKVFELIPQLKFLDGTDRDQEEVEQTESEEEGDDEEVDEDDDEDLDELDEIQGDSSSSSNKFRSAGVEKEEADDEDDVEEKDESNLDGGVYEEDDEGDSDEEDEQNPLPGDNDEEEEDELDDEEEDNEPGLAYLNKDEFSDEEEDGDFAPGEGEDDDEEEEEEIDEEASEEQVARGTKRKHEGDDEE